MKFRDWSLLRFYLLWAYRGRPSHPRAVMPTDPGKAWLLEKGSLRIRAEGVDYQVEAGQWVFPPRYLEEREFSPDAELLSIRFRMQWPDGKDVFGGTRPVIAPVEGASELTELARQLNDRVATATRNRGKDLLTCRCSLADYMAIEGLTARWIEAYAQLMLRLGVEPATPQTGDALLEEVRRQIEELPTSMILSREQLADSVGMSVSHLESLFAHQFGKTPSQYWQDCRYQKARDLLRGKKIPIKQIAFSLGFKTVARFSTWFRQHSGKSPSDYRARR